MRQYFIQLPVRKFIKLAYANDKRQPSKDDQTGEQKDKTTITN